MSFTPSIYWRRSAELLISESQKTSMLLVACRRNVEALSSLASDLIAMPSNVWSGPSKRKMTARAIDIAGFADKVSLISEHLLYSQESITLLSSRIADNLTALDRYSSSDVSEAVVNEARGQTNRDIALLTAVLSQASQSIRAAASVIQNPPGDFTPINQRSSSVGVMDSRAAAIASSQKSTPEAVAAALLSSSGSQALLSFRKALESGIFKKSFAKKVKRLVMSSGPKAHRLNTSINDWPLQDSSKTRHPVFLDLPVFRHAPSPFDIVQGNVGDCWLMASLATLAVHNPDAISSMVKDNYDGSYDVHFADGVTTTVSGDVWLDTGNDPGTTEASGWYSEVLYGARSRPERGLQGSQWPWIIEKAFAARFGSYQRLDGGLPSWALGVLYNKDTFSQQVQANGAVAQWDNARLGETVPYSFVAPDTFGSSPLDERLLSGPSVVGINGHAYAVLGTVVRDGETYAKLYNPYGFDDIDLKDASVEVVYGKSYDGLMLVRLVDLGRAGVFMIDGFK